MEKTLMKESVRKAFLLGGMCSLSYLTVYLARNTLGAVSPQMIEDGVFTTENIGSLSSLYFITYALGQLINGVIGDKIKAKYMISLGLLAAGVSCLVFTAVSGSFWASYVVYGMTGFFLSMIYAPMTKVVAENVSPMYVTRCSLGYTLASFLGSPLAGLLAMAFAWQGVFVSSSAALLCMGAACFLVFTLFEKRGVVRYNQYRKEKNAHGGYKVLFRYRIIQFTVVSMITGVVRTTVIFWLPTYISQYLGFSAERSAMIFTIATLFISLSAFVSVIVYERLGHKMELTMLLSFIGAAVGFLGAFLIKQPVLNTMFLIIAIFSSDSAATMLFSRYCPSLRDTGMVSAATGFLDFSSYVAASISSTLFANAVSVIGWGGLILVWLGLMMIGVVLSFVMYRRPMTDLLE